MSLLWTAATCRRFQSADMSMHSKKAGSQVRSPTNNPGHKPAFHFYAGPLAFNFGKKWISRAKLFSESEA